MSKSYHATVSQLRGKTKGQLAEMTKDPDSILNELATKMGSKKKVKKRKKGIKNKETAF